MLDDTRRQLAQQHLRQSQLTLKELAFALGFGETGSLHRACQRWFGMSPARYRAQAV
ncbi:helix-turn-helix domain-containing protein [Ottowia pentelensis]|uniref:helix-turn-helix domain-containing protein n=1 Tax=Ottowia pentelensis TaxID=511108 RepID=UPI003631793B